MSLWIFFKFLPIVICIGAPITICMTYGIAVAKGHIYPLFPYVSDTGTKPPESCIFGFCLSTNAFFILCIFYVRYLQVREFVILNPSVKINPKWNKAAFGFGITSVICMNVVANFQELSEFTTHLVGALLCFLCGTVYFIIQTVFTRRMYPDTKALFSCRVTLTTINVLSLVGMFAPVHCALKEFKGDDILQWSEKDGGYTLHLISTFSEWIMIATFAGYLYTLFWDFKKFDMEPIVIKFKDNHVAADEDGAKRNQNLKV